MPDYFEKPDIPQYSISLFSDAATQGAAAAKAIPGIATQIVRGVNQGIDDSQRIRSNEAKIDIQNEQLKQEEAATYKAQLEQEVLQANEETAKITILNKLEAEKEAAVQKRDDLINNQKILQAAQDPANAQAIFQDPSFQGTLSRNHDLAMQTIGVLASKGANAKVLDAARAQFDAVEMEKRALASAEQTRKMAAEAAFKKKESSDDAALYLKSYPGFDDTTDPRNLEAIDRSSIELDAAGNPVIDPSTKRPKPTAVSMGKGIVLMDGDRVIANNIAESEGPKLRENLRNYKSYKLSTNPPPIKTKTPDAEVDELPADELRKIARQDGGGAPSEGASNNNIVEAAKARNAQNLQAAKAAGQATSYTSLIAKGNAIGKSNTPVQTYTQTPQSVATAPGVPPITQAVPPDYKPDPYAPGRTELDTPKKAASLDPASTAYAEERPAFGSVSHAEERLSVMVGAPVQLNTNIPAPSVTQKVYDKISSIPALQDAPAYLKGMAAVESAGNTNAVAPDGGVGLFQFMPGTAADVGLKDRKNPKQSLDAAVKYNQQLYTQISKKMSNALSSQGLSIKPDPRMVLAAYNGGAKYILNGLAAGNTTWPEMKEYLKSVKNPAAARINTEYPDKVITASIPFMKGGNASDDLWMKDMLNFGIVDVA